MNKQMNNFEDNFDWEKLVSLSDDELEAAIAKQEKHPQADNIKGNKPNLAAKLVAVSDENLGQNQEKNLDPEHTYNFEQPKPNWDYLLELEPTPSHHPEKIADDTQFPDWEKAIAISSNPADTTLDWETVNNDNEANLKSNDSMTEGWRKASNEVNTEFMQEWEESAAKISALTGIDVSDSMGIATNDLLEPPKVEAVITPIDGEYPDWENAIATDARSEIQEEEVISDWKMNVAVIDNEVEVNGWETASNDVNTEFMQEWEQSAARISALTGIDLSDNESKNNELKHRETSQTNARVNDLVTPVGGDRIKTEAEKSEDKRKQISTGSDDSGPLPPLPVLPPKRVHSKKTPSAGDVDWFEKYHDSNKPEVAQTISPSESVLDPKSNYHFDRLAEEICDSDEFSWTSLNQKAQNQPQQPQAKSSAVWNPSEKIVIDLDDEQVESTAVWNYNPPESFTEKTGDTSGFSQKLNFDLPDLKKSFISVYTNLWHKLKAPIIAIAALAGLFGIYSIPSVQKAVTEAGLKSQLLKDASHKELSGLNFQDAKLEKVNFTNANLANVNFKKANLNGANLSGANLKGTNLSGANLRGANLKDSKIELKGKQSTKLEPEDLLMWRIINQPIAGRNLSRQDLDGFFLGSAILKKANFTEAKLMWVNFVNADLAEAQLIGANITGVNLVGANLKGANFTGANWIKHEPKTDSTTTCPNGKKGPCKLNN
jgi:hypothetical protein